MSAKIFMVALLVLMGASGCTRSAPPMLPSVVVYKNESCSCCKLWVQHLQASGFDVHVNNVDNLDPVKQRVGIPVGKGSCHTAEMAGYFIEGHVPAEDVKRLLAIKPDAKGLTVPGMPVGSPGMKNGNQHQPYDVLLVDKAGNTTVFAHHSECKLLHCLRMAVNGWPQ